MDAVTKLSNSVFLPKRPEVVIGAGKSIRLRAPQPVTCQNKKYTSASKINVVSKQSANIIPEDSVSSLPDGRTVGQTLEALRSRNRAPKRWLGQHYMVNDEITVRTVEAASIVRGDFVLEIGPGTGALTQALLDKGATVIAVEKDRDMITLCEERFADNKSVKIVHEDVMRWNVRETLEPFLQKRRKKQGLGFRAKVVSNLPFNITTEILQLLLPMGDLFSSVTLMLQDDAAVRIIDPTPRPTDYRKMNLFVHFFSKPAYHFFVDRKNFLPPPKVHAAVVSFRVKLPSEYPPVCSHRAFFSMVNSAFNGKRKMLRNTLQHLHPSEAIKGALLSLDLRETARPEELTLEQFLELFSRLQEPSRSGSETQEESLST